VTNIATGVTIGLNAVLAAVEKQQPSVLCVESGGNLGLPYGPFDPLRHRTFEIGMREWVERQTSLSLGFIEQLYTFGDKGREAALAGGAASDRVVSVGYLALAPAAAGVEAPGAGWRNWYSFFPWEDWRNGAAHVRPRIIEALKAWAAHGPDAEQALRRTRINRAFGLDEFGWEEERSLDRYELMYEAELVIEAARGRLESKDASSVLDLGAPMISDHRRILATAIGRLRGKLKYRPVIFEMVGREFTLLQLQRTIEAIVGYEFHKQNFRRSAEKSGFIEPTGKTSTQAAGRPAALFRVNRETLKDRAAGGLTIPRLRPQA